MGERLVVDQQMCDMVKLMLGGGATQEKVSKLLGIGESTVSRIKLAGFDRNTFYMNNDRRRIMEKNRRADKKFAEAMDRLKEEQKELPGQMQLELVYDQSIAEEYRKEQEQKQEQSDMAKLMRFQAAKVELMLNKMDELKDAMMQIIRCIRAE